MKKLFVFICLCAWLTTINLENACAGFTFLDFLTQRFSDQTQNSVWDILEGRFKAKKESFLKIIAAQETVVKSDYSVIFSKGLFEATCEVANFFMSNGIIFLSVLRPHLGPNTSENLTNGIDITDSYVSINWKGIGLNNNGNFFVRVFKNYFAEGDLGCFL